MGQLSAWSEVSCLPHTQLDGSLSGVQPYLRQIAFLKLLLWREKPCWCSGRAVSKLDAPFSLASSIARLSTSGSCSVMVFARCFSLARLVCRRWDFICSLAWFEVNGLVCSSMLDTKEAVSCSEA